MNFRFLAFNWTELSKGDLAVLTTLAGLLIVFAVLIILTWIISLISKMGASKKKEKALNSAETTASDIPMSSLQTAPAEDDSLIVVIAAAVYAFGESAGRKLAIKSIRQVNTHKAGRSIWAASGVYENTRPF